MDRKRKIIAQIILQGEPLYKSTNERIQLTEYYLRHPEDFDINDFKKNMQIEVRKLTLAGKMKRNRTPLDWEQTFIYLETNLDIEYILGKDLNVEKLTTLYKKCELQEVIINTQEKMIQILNKPGYSQTDEIRLLELKEDLDLYNKILEETK